MAVGLRSPAGEGWLQFLCVSGCCFALAAARSVVSGGGFADVEPLSAKTLRVGSAASAVALVVQILLYRITGGPDGSKSQEHEENKDAALIWREDEGISKLAPLLPEPKTESKKPLAKYTMAEVAKHNTRDDVWLIIDGRVYDVTNYVDKHPGMALPILNMAGKDCTDVFANYHAARIYKHMLPPFLVGEVSDLPPVPPHVMDFRAVRQELLRRGLFETDMRFYAKHGAFLSSLFLFALYLTIGCESLVAHMAGAAVMGIFWQQLAGIGHDMGHSAISHNFQQDHFFCSSLVALMGISVCWWKKNHNTHHVVCNSIEHDPDIQHMPAFAVTPGIFKKPFWSTYYVKWVTMDRIARFLVSNQHMLFIPIMMVARVNLYIQSLIQLCSKEPLHYRKLELFSFFVYFSWLGTVLSQLPSTTQAVCWILASHAVSGLLHVQICISHFSMETYHGHAYNDADDEWYITQLKTTMNVDTPPLLDWVHIGLQFQIEHHLFPRLPRHNLREARKLILGVCEKHKLPYVEEGFFQALGRLLSSLKATALVARETTKGDGGFYECALWDGMTLTG
eukprot:TRINITY_DN13672_c0_g1_i2.p1 TRINITY_DN13672_c0_g1~~TRINITY_DN13672_c0_g1_i2.p1  ORF type:complete len:565 (-),score=141.87 TRINITY_DN13672_c0_g1_i2:247-1941(-)